MQLKDETMLSIGMISIALGILIGRFVNIEYSGFSVSAFAEGVLVGLSLVMNLAYLIRLRSKKVMHMCTSFLGRAYKFRIEKEKRWLGLNFSPQPTEATYKKTK